MFRISRIRTEGKGVFSLFWGFWIFFHDVIIFDFKFGSNRIAGSEDTILFVARTDGDRAIRDPVVSDFRVSDVIIR